MQAGTEAGNLGPTLRKELFSEMCNAARPWRHTVNLLNLKKTSFFPLNCVPTLKRTKRDILLRKEKLYGNAYPSPSHARASRSILFGRRRRRRPARQFFTLIFQSSGTLETDGLAAAIRNDRSPLRDTYLKISRSPGAPLGHMNWSRFDRSNRLRTR